MPRQRINFDCTIEGCDAAAISRNWCKHHYDLWRAHGDPLLSIGRGFKGAPENRFWAKVDPCRSDGCMIWTGAKSGGYGTFKFEGRTGKAHHFLVGRPKKPFEWDHLCRTPLCVNPEHLELVTKLENYRRSSARGGKLWRLADVP